MAVAIALLLAFGGSSYAAGRRIPTARVYNNPGQIIINNTTTPLQFNSEVYDVGDLHSTSIDTSCLTAPMDGIYAISATVNWDSNSTGWRFVALATGLTYIASTLVPAVSGNNTVQNVVTQFKLFKGDCVEVDVFQNTVSDFNVFGGDTHFEMTWIAPG